MLPECYLLRLLYVCIKLYAIYFSNCFLRAANQIEYDITCFNFLLCSKWRGSRSEFYRSTQHFLSFHILDHQNANSHLSTAPISTICVPGRTIRRSISQARPSMICFTAACAASLHTFLSTVPPAMRFSIVSVLW